MTDGFDILGAEDIGEYISLIILLVLVALSSLGGVIQKALKKAEEKRAEQARSREPQKVPRPGETPEAQKAPPQQQEEAVESLEREVKRLLGIEEPAPPPQLKVVAEAPRRRKPPTQPKPATPVQPSEPAWTTVRPAKPPRPIDLVAAVGVNLSDAAEARRAIIHQEILSPPKAMRRSPEIWDV